MKRSTTDRHELINWMFATWREAAWVPLSVLIFYLIGRALQLFDLFPRLDIPTHFIGGVAITYFYRSAVRSSQGSLESYPTQFKPCLPSHVQGQRSSSGSSTRTCLTFSSAPTWCSALRLPSWTWFWDCWGRLS
jgi:hypothetical protein